MSSDGNDKSNIKSLADRRRDILSIRELERVCELLVDEVEDLTGKLAQAETRLFRQGARYLVLDEKLSEVTGQMVQLQEVHRTLLHRMQELQDSVVRLEKHSWKASEPKGT